ncbi:MAG TPA: HAD-IC family P-type ATPase [Thiobacillus sp.]|nr:MAG: metal-transporting ATPase [Hydrogenophilales bacterium 28-61-11]OYZ57864.1 MAG: metal-transporting ATPase [Hydrogenophilales bacterium 16-61-112]OZA46123.1 MAG: metal-transporting ATPase [Hydrogenophilales bacterium 17-61-76]HQT31042.1 HAD-IC family P-type ATPase [Thiobacillus sp.]HQT69141.1 HAD-IC family P-type ATPase [Thiobacillus sp.]
MAKHIAESQVDWHSLSSEEAVAAQAVMPLQGLDSGTAAERLKQFGENRLIEARPRPLWLKFVDQFRNLLVVVLLFAATLTWAVGNLKDATVILIVVVFNAALGLYQERRAEKTLAALKEMLAVRSRVRRDGQILELDAARLVPGDIVLLDSGDRIPADGRLLAAHALEVDESALTGESHAVGKSIAALEPADLPLGDRLNLLYMNTVVTRGRAELLVTATGMATEMGKLAGMIAAAPESESPLQKQLDTLGKKLAAIAGVVVTLIFALDFLRGMPWTEAALTAVALAVAAIPEGLPAVVTVTLAIGMWRMAQNRAILKKLSAVETLGSTTVICSDKTGTLTLNQMTARAGWFAGSRFTVSGEGYLPAGDIQFDAPEPDFCSLLLPMVLCTESRVRDGKLIGDPTEGALWVLAQKGGLDPEYEQEEQPRIAEIPFDSAHKFMATFHHAGETVEMFVKGAPDVLLARANAWLAATGDTPLDAATRQRIETENEHLATQALRVLAVARRVIPAHDFDPAGELMAWANDWTFLGLAGLMDPPRAEAKRAIAQCKHAGIEVKMITGDHKFTAAAIGRELGLSGEVVSGAELDAMDEAELARRIDAIDVFARVSPAHKVMIVQALKADGHVTAMTGDGVNDAPALKAADIGVAMGITGTAVTKEAATLVLTDDNFATIVKAVEEGRVVYDNIVKFVRFQLSTNIGAMLTVLVATLMGMPTPFTAIQLLWVNIIMDGPPAMTLGIEPARPGIMRDKPRRQSAQILDVKRLARLAAYGATMMIGTLFMFQQGLATENPTYALTLAFTTFVLFQFFNVFNARVEHSSVFNANFFRNRHLWLALAGVLALQVMAVHWPAAQAIFGTTGLHVGDWLLSALVASSVLLLDEGRKALLGVWRRIATQ